MREHNRGVRIASVTRSRRGLALVAALAALGAVPASAEARHAHHHLRSARAACPGAFASALTLTPARGRHAMLCLINRIRRGHGLRALKPSRSLRRAAAGFATEMVSHGFFDHAAPGGPDLIARLRTVGFIRRDVFWTVGENLAWAVGGAARPEEIVRSWMHSGPHRRNILDRHFRLVGIGIDIGVPAASAAGTAKSQGGATYVADFGARRRP